MTYKNIRIKMKGGKSRLQRVQVLKSGKYKFVKNKTRARARTSKSKTVRSKTRRRHKGGNKRMGKRNLKIPIAATIGVLSMPNVRYTIAELMKGDVNAALVQAGGILGIRNDGRWYWDTMAANLTPLIIGALVSKFVGGAPLNLNKKLNIPFIKI